MALDPAKVVHRRASSGVIVCGADEPNQQATTIRAHVTCDCCSGRHRWAGRKVGGPTDPDEWVAYCAVCGAEKVDE